MSYKERAELYKKIQQIRKKKLIAYVTSVRPNCGVQMAGDVIPSIISIIDTIPPENKEIDFLIISNGGDPIASLRIINILRERFEKVSVLVPNVAFSAATVLALGADEIVMHPYSNLGPVDPQLTVHKENNSTQSFSTEDVTNYISFLKDDVGITDQQYLSSAANVLADSLGPLNIGFSKKSLQLTISLGKRMLESHLQDKSKADSIVNILCSSYYHHGYAVSRKEAQKIGLPIVEPDKELESLLWEVWLDFSSEMKCDRVFDPVADAMENELVAKTINTVEVVSIPAGLPQNIVNQKIQQFANSAKMIQRPYVNIRNLIASCESVDTCYELNSSFDVIVWRNPNLELCTNITRNRAYWNKKEEQG